MRRLLLCLPLLSIGCRCGAEGDARPDTVAECVSAEGDVRFHPTRDVVWKSVSSGHRFALGDWVRTAEAARARIRFDGGAVVEMDPASTVIIETEAQSVDESLGPLIALESGSLRGSTAKGVSGRVSLRTPSGERVSLAPETAGETFDYRVSVRSSGEVELAVTAGQAEVTTGRARGVLRAGEAQLVRRGELSPAERLLEAPALLDPADGGALALEAGQPVEFRWAPVSGAARYVLERGADAELREATQRVTVERTSWSTPLPSGRHFWRVSAESDSGLAGRPSPTRRFELDTLVVREHLQSPPDGVEIASRRRRFRVEFGWRALEGAPGYEIVVAADEKLERPVLSELTAEPRFVTEALGPGVYYWGVRSRDASQTPLYRRPFRFRLRTGALELETPKKLEWR